MKLRVWMTVGMWAWFAGTVSSQTLERKAMLTGGNGNRGKCTIEIVVDGQAEVEVRGDTAILRNLFGQPPQWRRFQCSSVMPANPPDFRFAGVDGRGKMSLARDPRSGGAAVVRIDDPKAGSEGYTFDLMWSGSGQGGTVPGPARDGGYGDRRGGDGRPDGRPPDGRQDGRPDGRQDGRQDGRDDQRGNGARFSVDQAVRVCQDAVRQQAGERLHADDLAFRRTVLDDHPGRHDWIVGAFDVRRRDGREDTYRFSCSVNFDDGRVRSAEIEPLDRNGGAPGNDRRGGSSNADVLRSCQRGVEDRLSRDGYGRIEFRSIQVDDRPGRNDSVVGNVRAENRDGSDSLDFACAVDFGTGEVRGVEVRRR